MLDQPLLFWIIEGLGIAAIASGAVFKYWIRPPAMAIKKAVAYINDTRELLDVQLLNGEDTALTQQLHDLVIIVKGTRQELTDFRNTVDDRYRYTAVQHRAIRHDLDHGTEEFRQIRAELAKLQQSN